MEVDIICNYCKKTIETVERKEFNFFKKDFCNKECKDKYHENK